MVISTVIIMYLWYNNRMISYVIAWLFEYTIHFLWNGHFFLRQTRTLEEKCWFRGMYDRYSYDILICFITQRNVLFRQIINNDFIEVFSLFSLMLVIYRCWLFLYLWRDKSLFSSNISLYGESFVRKIINNLCIVFLK